MARELSHFGYGALQRARIRAEATHCVPHWWHLSRTRRADTR